MKLHIENNKSALGIAAATSGAARIRATLQEKGQATLVVATGASQFGMLDALVKQQDIDWSKITIFHLDEYLGLPASHPASFQRYLRERLINRVAPVKAFIGIDGTAEVAEEIARLNHLIRQHDIDLCFAGIGENCHLAFNDPPADFQLQEPYHRVKLDEQCRQQQLGEGWFDTLDDVPQYAISMSIQQIARAKCIILSVPDSRKASAVAAAVAGPISAMYPASWLQQHPNCSLYLEPESASLLPRPLSDGAL
ncbi:glucosamine-6-phosphate deaminase [Rahnella woolbedingensis]|uniref:Glucosamine-6-phosphate deaminase n=1 Tax=Rahnella woolbedingensis TaxID=1510574 RepID=A0A419N2J8_9GAMM|nr:glucosamine-6-phosphate deaminase [Rahnella woolbedingensis]RJT34215.1 glucosamine-6-phosphate deaminase [Rahnella woolbedingensis]